MKRTGSLFHTIVIVGAALGTGMTTAGCGDDEIVPSGDAQRPDAMVADARTDAPVDGPAVDGPDIDGRPVDAEVDAMIIIL
jgi:hypothetical protein